MNFDLNYLETYLCRLAMMRRPILTFMRKDGDGAR